MDYSPWSKAKKWQISAPTKFWIATHHLKGLFVSFPKIRKFLILDQRYSSYGCWKMFNYIPFIQWFGNSFGCHNLNSVDPISNFLWFSESLEKNYSNGVIKNYIWEIKVFPDLAIPWSPWSKAEKWQIRPPTKFWIATHHLKGLFVSFPKIRKFLTLDQRYSSYGCWKMFNYIPFIQWFGDSFGCHNLNSMDPISNFLWFSESLEKNNSNGVIKNHIWEIKVFPDLAIPWIIAHGPRPKNDKLGPPTKFWIATRHLKGLFLSFPKIMKLDHWYYTFWVWAVQAVAQSQPWIHRTDAQ